MALVNRECLIFLIHYICSDFIGEYRAHYSLLYRILNGFILAPYHLFIIAGLSLFQWNGNSFYHSQQTQNRIR